MYKGFVNIGGYSIYFEYINQKYQKDDTPLLIFLHHGLGSTQQWENFPKLLSNAVQCPALLYDRPGYGESGPLKEKMDVDFLHKEALIILPGLIRELNINKKIILIGHSDGGTIAIIFASQNPDNLIGTITEAPHVFVEEITLKGISNNVEEYNSGKTKRLLSIYHGDKTEFTFLSWTGAWLSEKFRPWNIESLLPGIKTPLLVIYGKEDEFSTLLQVDAIVKSAKEYVSTSIIPDCGHFPHKQYKDKTISIMKEFILRLDLF